MPKQAAAGKQNPNKAPKSKRTSSPKGLSIDEVILHEIKEPAVGQTQVLHPFTVARSQHHIGGVRGTVYALLALAIVAVLVVISYLQPLALLRQAEPVDRQSALNFSLIRLFSESNLYIPADGTVLHEPVLHVSGTLRNGMSLVINDVQVEPNAQNWFSLQLPLQPGKNTVDLFLTIGRQSHHDIRTYSYVPQMTTPLSSPITSALTSEENAALSEIETRLNQSKNPNIPAQQLVLTVNVFPETATLRATVDRTPQAAITLYAGQNYQFTANESIVITTDNASSTVLTLNGTDLGAMGKAATAATRALTTSDIP